MPLLHSRRVSPPFGWYSFYRPAEGRRLSRPRWLVTYRNKVPHRESNANTVTHPSTNRAQRWLTSLIKSNALPLRQTATRTVAATVTASSRLNCSSVVLASFSMCTKYIYIHIYSPKMWKKQDNKQAQKEKA